MSTRSSLAVLALVLVAVTAAIVLLLRGTEERATPESAPRDALATTTREDTRSELAPDSPPASNVVEPREGARSDATRTPETLARRHEPPLTIACVLREKEPSGISLQDVAIRLTRPDGVQHANPDANGRFELGPFEPGRYHLEIRSNRHRTVELDVDLVRGRAGRVREIVLEPWISILVRARTPEGEPLARTMMSSPAFGYRFPISAIATRDPIERDERGFPIDRSCGTYEGIGHAAVDSLDIWDVGAAPMDAFGRLSVPNLPTHVALVSDTRVLDVRAVSEPDVTFVVSLERAKGTASCVRARVIDARTGLPLAGATLRSSAERSRARGASSLGPPDRVELCGLDEGFVRVQVACEGRATWERGVVLEGRDVDLGDVPLEPAVTLRGRVLDADGRPRGHRIEIVPLDPASPYATIEVASNPSGFEVAELGATRYVVRSALYGRLVDADVAKELLLLAPYEIDLARPVENELVLHLQRIGGLQIELDLTHASGRVAIMTRAGLPIWSGAAMERRYEGLSLPRGPYRVRWSDGAETIEREVEVRAERTIVSIP